VKHKPAFGKWVLIALVVWGGFALRLPHIGFGLPFTRHNDEVTKIIDIKRILAGNLQPRKFYHPTFLLYSVAGAVTLYDALTPGRLAHRIAAGDEWEIYLVGRFWIAFLGACTILIVSLIGWRYFGFGAGLVAALILAVAPLHLLTSHYIKEDVPMTFWMALALYFLFALATTPSMKNFVLTGLFTGFAISTKYPALLFVVLILFTLALFLKKQALEKRFLVRTAIMVACILVGFALFTPYAVRRYKKFHAGFRFETKHVLQGHEYEPISPWHHAWTFHLRKSVIPGLTPSLALLCAAAIVFFIFKRSKKTTILLFGAALFYFPFEAVYLKPPPDFERYMVPLLVFLALLGGCFVAALWQMSRSLRLRPCPYWRVGIILLLAVAFSFPLRRDIVFIKSLREDTRETARNWILKHIPPGARIFCVGRAAYVPDLRELPYTVSDRYWEGYDNYDYVRQFDYVVASSFLYDRYFTIYPLEIAPTRFYRRLFSEAHLVKEFRPQYFSYGFHNPTIRIYRL
jgi:hypothetical protein